MTNISKHVVNRLANRSTSDPLALAGLTHRSPQTGLNPDHSANLLLISDCSIMMSKSRPLIVKAMLQIINGGQ